MPISKPRSASPGFLLGALLAGSAVAQNDARQSIGEEGKAAIERLREATTRAQAKSAKAAPQRTPGAIPSPAPAMRRRAFDALRRHVQPPDLADRAREANRQGQAALARERQATAARLGQRLGLTEEEGIAFADGISSTPTRWVPVLFVSSSMPIAVLRAYAAQLEPLGGVMALRGMPGGLRKVAPLASLTARILRLDPGCEGPDCTMRTVQIIIDPMVFRQHGVDRVPALAMLPGDPARAYCEREADSPRARHLVYGDSALSGLIEEYARLGGKQEVRDVQARLRTR